MASIALRLVRKMISKQVQIGQIGGGEIDYAAERGKQAANQSLPNAKGVSFRADVLNGVPVEFSVPQKRNPAGVLFYIHGGGYCYGTAQTSRGVASAFAKETGMEVCSISYRLAPENRFPAAVDDCFAVYQSLLQKYPGKPIALVGDSGGGTFCLVTALRAKAKGIQMPACLCLFSPCTDLSQEYPSAEKYWQDDWMVSDPKVHEHLREVYLPEGVDPRDPDVSPLLGDYTGFPPMFVEADSKEVLRDDSELLVEKAQAAGVSVTYQLLEGTFHAFNTFGTALPESKRLIRDASAFLHHHISYNRRDDL